MAPHFLTAFALSWTMSTPAAPRGPNAAALPSPIVASLSFKDRCALDRVVPGAGKIEIRLAADPPAPLPVGRAYAMLFMRPLGLGRWQFDWSLSASGYTGCPSDENAEPGGLEACRHPAFLHGTPSADLRIVITKKRSGFEAEVANLEVAKWSAPPCRPTDFS